MTDQQPGTDVAVRPERQWATVQNVQPLLDTHRFEHFQRAAKALMHSSILNESVRGSSPEQCFSNLMLVFDLSDRWKLPPMSIAQGIAIVHNKVVYEGKLIAAMLDASLGVRLHYWWTGERGSTDYRIYVSDQPWDDLSEQDLEQLRPGIQIRGRRVIDGSVGEWRTFQKDQRTPNPAWTGAATQNQLAYRGAREWARRYEPAQMLGVYGDDEIDAITLRMEARDVTPAAPGLSAGFSRPAEPVQDAEIEPLEPQEPSTAETPQETPQEPQAKPAARKGRGKAADAPQEPESGQGDDPKREAVLADRKAALEKARDMGHAAGWQAFTGAGPDVLDRLLAECQTDEERGHVENGWADGTKGLDQSLEDAYALGLQGTPTTRAEWFQEGEDKGDADSNRRWERIHAEWKRGADDGVAEREQDADDGPDAVDADVDGDESTTGDDALDAIAEAEPDVVDQVLQDEADQDPDMAEPQGDAIDAWERGLAALSDWKAIKASMNALIKTDAWTSATPERQANVRRLAWQREAALIEAGDDRMDFINDLTAFRCWIETTDDTDAIDGNWRALVRQPIYTGLKPDQQQSLQAAVLKRVEQIKATAGKG